MMIETSTDIRRIPAPGSGILWFLDVHGNNLAFRLLRYGRAFEPHGAWQGGATPSRLS